MPSTTTTYVRIFFILFCVLFSTIFSLSTIRPGENYTNLLIGSFLGIAFAMVIISINVFFARFTIRSLISATIGLVVGCLISNIILPIFDSMMISSTDLSTITRTAVTLFFVYFSITVISRASENISLDIPFLKFNEKEAIKQSIIIDTNVLQDPRFIDLASSGILDSQLLIPVFIVKELNIQLEHSDETIRSKARRSLDGIKKLEEIPSLNLSYTSVDFPEAIDSNTKLLSLARQLNSYILTCDTTSNIHNLVTGIKFINLHSLLSYPKIQTQAGEYITIKIQRYGKEPRQGIGYLDDGTMVVVNGGAEFLGEGIRAQVLSVKQTLSGRMVFCNATDESNTLQEEANLVGAGSTYDSSAKNYFTL